MIRITGRFYARCNRCGRLHKIELDTYGMSLECSSYERSMGTSFDYSFSEEYTCECGNCFSIEIEGSEYPVGTVEVGDIFVNGAEITSEPRIEGVYEPGEYYDACSGRPSYDPREIILGMSDRQFELFVGSVLYEMGYEDVRVTQRTRDGAYDFTAVDRHNGIQNYVIGECKHYSTRNKVSEDVIRKLHDAQYQQHANTAIVVTSSTFTRDARMRADEYRMTLWDIDDLIYYGKHLLSDYV